MNKPGRFVGWESWEFQRKGLDVEKSRYSWGEGRRGADKRPFRFHRKGKTTAVASYKSTDHSKITLEQKRPSLSGAAPPAQGGDRGMERDTGTRPRRLHQPSSALLRDPAPLASPEPLEAGYPRPLPPSRGALPRVFPLNFLPASAGDKSLCRGRRPERQSQRCQV